MKVRPVARADETGWARMRTALWPEENAAELAAECDHWFHKPRHDDAVFVAERHGVLVGMAEVSIRRYAEGCVTDRVGYLEAWWVDPGHRRQGVGEALVHAAERWACEQGCREFGSDAALANAVSHLAHRALGFREAGRIICYAKSLSS